MDKAYVRALEHGLLSREVELDVEDIRDSTTLFVVQAQLPAQKVALKPPPGSRTDPALDRLTELRSGDASRVRAALSPEAAFDPLAIPQIIRLLAWNEVSDAARAYLASCSERVPGQLTDGLLDQNSDFAVRRRIPRILAQHGSQRAVDALLRALGDAHFEIRFQAGRALEYMHRTHPGLLFDEPSLMQTIERELSVSKPIWQGRKLLDRRDATDASYSFLDELLQGRADQSLEHVFSLLALILPREPLKVAFRALHSDDHMLRGLALEYLETTLPPRVFAHFPQMLESGPAPSAGRDPQTVLDKLMASRESIMLRLRTGG
jgi:hypothetical protein